MSVQTLSDDFSLDIATHRRMIDADRHDRRSCDTGCLTATA